MEADTSIKVSFLLSFKNDLDLFKEFYKKQQYPTGENDSQIFLGFLKEELMKQIPNLNKERCFILIKNVLKREYKKNKKLLNIKLQIAKSKWQEIENSFFQESKKVFDGHPFPKGHYHAYISIWGRYIRNLESKSITFPPNQRFMLLVIIHEFLHIIFYDYFYQNFKNKLNKEKLWELSEIINVLIMNEKPFLTWAEYPSLPYPAHKKNYKKLKEIYDKRESMHDFIKKAISVLKD
ncbi:MAG: hypothetical protein U9Q69_04480 [Nanoarchaeota archaeon]|nr:hypothetical protein [Nanoarchaeota archaeon]